MVLHVHLEGLRASSGWMEYDPWITVIIYNGCWKLISPKIEQLLFFLMYKVDNSEKRFTVLQFIFPDEKILEPGFWILGSQASSGWIEYTPAVTVTEYQRLPQS